jgi:hypothetical protein
MKIILRAITILVLLCSSVAGLEAVKAQYASYEQLTISVSPSGNLEALAVYFTATVNGGVPPYNLQWYCNNSQVEGATASYYKFIPSSFGAYSIYAMVIDSLNGSAASNITIVTVKPYLQIDLAMHNYLTYTTIGQSVYFTAEVADGTPPFRYQWSYRPYHFGETASELYPIGDWVEGATSQNYTFIPASAGHYLITVRVWDAQNIEGYFMSLPPGIWVNAAENTTSSPNLSPTPNPSPTSSPTPSSTIPEYPTWPILLLLPIISLSPIALAKRKNRRQTNQKAVLLEEHIVL